MDTEEYTHKYLMDCVQRLGICLHEHLIPYTMERNWKEDMKEIMDNFSIVEGFDCMKYEVDTVEMIIDLHDAIVETPELLLSDYQLEWLLTNFQKHMTDDEEYDEKKIKDYIKELQEGKGYG